MGERILVRGELSPWVHTSRVFTALAAIVGVVLALAVAQWGWIVAAAGGALWLVFENVAWQARRVRTWLTLHPDGIELEDTRGYRAIHDSQVTAAALETRKNLVNGEFSSTTRKFRLWTEDQPESILMENKIKAGRIDPLAELIDRLLEQLRKRMQDDLARGGTASGDGWHLSRTALTLGHPPSDQQLPLSEISAVETFDGQMCVWQRGIDMAIAKLPLSGRNVYLLPGLVQPFLHLASGQSESAKSTVGLGRVLFERRPPRSLVLALEIGGITLTAVGAALMAAYFSRQNADEGLMMAGVMLPSIGLLLVLLGFWLAFSCFRCQERGVCKTTLLSQKSLRYEDVGSLQFSAIKHYHNGAYIGTQLTVRLRPVSADRGPGISYAVRTKGDDDDLDSLRDQISRIVATRMSEQLHAGNSVVWTRNLQFTPDGIRYRPSSFLGRKEPQLLPYEEYGGYDLKQGAFHLFARSRTKPIMTEQAAAENFYPGFFLLLTLLHQPAAEQVAG